MKGSKKVVEKLNALLADELTAISQYMVHAEMCEDWGYKRLQKGVYDRAITEMKHAEKLIERILFLESKPIVSKLKEISIGDDVPAQIRNDLEAELGAVKSYNEGIAICVEAADNATKDLLEEILLDEDEHVDQLETWGGQIEQMGLENFLATQVDE